MARQPGNRSGEWLTLMLALVLAGSFALADDEAETLWKESTRDVWVDGRLDRGTVVLRAADPPRLALFATRTANEALVVDLDALTVERMAMTAPALGETGWESTATGKARAAKGAGVARVDTSTWLLTLPDRSIVIASHDGTPGPIERDEVFATVPSWEALYRRYEPGADEVAALAGYEGELQLTLAFGTWCGDSKREVPRLLKALDAANNAGIALELISLDGSFEEPGVLIRGESLTNVPTLIVSRGGREIGRVVETPTTGTMAGDLAQMLAGEPLLHPGRWEREERIAAGRYSLRDAAGRESGVEDWELYSLADGGTLLHAWSDLEGRLTDVWHRRDEAGQSAFVEITRTRGDWHSRTRHSVRDSVLNATTRGNGTGNIRQTVPFDPGTVLVTPAVVDVGRDWALGGKPAQATTAAALALGGSGESAAARPADLSVTYRGRESVSTPAGPFTADRVALRLDGARSDWWLDAALGLPVRGRDADGNEVVLVRLERTPTSAAAPFAADRQP